MLQVGLTGNAASGKSTVARIWSDAGVPVVSADVLARRAVEPGSEGLTEVVREFGPDVLAADGTLDRGRMRARIVRDAGARRRLEAILHPRIAGLREAWIRERAREGAPLVVSEVPLLYEAGLEGEFDLVVFVDAPEAERRRRLVEERAMDPDEADRLMASQGDPAEKRRLAHHILDNDGSLEELASRAGALLAVLRTQAASR